MEKEIFRQKSLERVSSPEQLNDYIRVSRPSMWMVLAAIIALLVGVCVWGALGRLETTVSGAVWAQSSGTVCYVRQEEAAGIQPGMTVRVGDQTFTVAEVAAQPVSVTAEAFSDYFLYVGGFQSGEWAVAVTLDGTLPEGAYAAEIVTDSVSPLSFVFN